MVTISIDDMQRDPAGCLRRVDGEETLVVVRGQVVVAEIRPVPGQAAVQRPFGLCAGEFVVPDDVDQTLTDEVMAAFGV